MANKKYQSDALEAVHKMMESAHRVGAIDKTTMRDFDTACLAPIRPLSPSDIKELREREKASQKVFASHLNVPVTLVSQWERGERKPSGPAQKLLSLVDRKGLSSIA